MIDHQFSPGTPAVPEGTVFEAPTLTCSHCQRLVILNPERKRPRNYCYAGDHYVCDLPGCNTGTCTSIRRVLDELQEAAFRQLKEI